MHQNGESGLPNLPYLARFWQPNFYYPSLDATQWIQLAPADPSRWLIDFADLDTGPFRVTVDPDDLFTRGWRINFGSSLVFTTKDYGNLVQLEWYGYSGGNRDGVQVFTQAIRFKGQT